MIINYSFLRTKVAVFALCLFTLTLSLVANAATEIIRAQVKSFDIQNDQLKISFWDHSPVSVVLNDQTDIDTIKKSLTSSHDNGDILDISIDSDSKAIASVVALKDSKDLGFSCIPEDGSGEISQCSLETMSSEMKTFPSLKSAFRRVLGGLTTSQCFRRCHVWSKMLEVDKLTSGKIFIFYAIEKYKKINPRHKWWFHVASYLKDTEGGVQVIDDTFYPNEPKTISNWILGLAKNIGECRVIQNYSVYEQERELKVSSSGEPLPLCYILKVPRHYFLPEDIAAACSKGKFKNEWDKGELSSSRKEFNNPPVFAE